MKTIELDSWRGRAIVITAVEDADSWFSPEELREVDSFRLPKRKMEWKLSRIAAKKLAIERGLVSHQIEMRRIFVEDKRPRLSNEGQTRASVLHLSLSHSAPYAAAAIDVAPVGIDIERVREISESAAHLFLTDDDIAAMQDCSLEHRLLHFWAAKEAEWKRQGGEILTLKRVKLRLEDVSPAGLRFDRVETQLIGDLVTALTRPTS